MSASDSATPSQVAAVRSYLLKLVAAILTIGVLGSLALLVWLSHSPLFAAVESYIFASSTVSSAVGRVTNVTPCVFGSEVSESEQAGEATLPVVISGMRSKRRAVVSAVRHQGTWTVTQVVLRD